MNRTLRGFMLMVGIFCSLTLALAAPAAAQTETIDIADIGQDVERADVEDLLTGLENPMRDRDLPDGFSDAEYVDPEDVDEDSGLLGGDSLDGTLGSVAYTLAGDPEVIGGETVIVSVQYVVYDAAEVGDDPLADFIDGAEGGLEDVPDDAEATVETVEIEGEDAALITFSQETTDSTVVVQYLAIPVGNVFVFASVTVAGETVDGDDVYDFTEELTLSAIAHLGEIAADS